MLHRHPELYVACFAITKPTLEKGEGGIGLLTARGNAPQGGRNRAMARLSGGSRFKIGHESSDGKALGRGIAKKDVKT